MSDPAVQQWQQALGESTSAQLRRVEADLTRAEKELHDALRRAADLEQVREELAQAKLTSEGLLADLQDAEGERDEARRERDYARAQLDDLIATNYRHPDKEN